MTIGVNRNLWRTRSGLVTRGNFSIDRLALYLPLWHPEMNAATIVSKDLNAVSCTVTEAVWGAQGYTFDLVNDNINCGACFDTVTPFTIEMWRSYTTSDANLGLISKWSAVTGYAWALITGAGPVLTFAIMQSGVAKLASTVAAYNDGVFHHICCMFDGSNVLIEVDGTLATGDAITAPDSKPTTIISIGDTGYSTPAGGTAGEVRLHSRLLDAVERKHNRLATQWRYL